VVVVHLSVVAGVDASGGAAGGGTSGREVHGDHAPPRATGRRGGRQAPHERRQPGVHRDRPCRAFAAVEASGAAALTCSGVEGGQARQALAAARDAAHAALQGGVHIDRVVTRLRHGALALVDDLASGRTPDPTPDQGHHHPQRRGAPIVSPAPSPSALGGSRE
jgi:hypothetical protein